MYPVYNNKVVGTSYVNPQAPVHIISGAAGCPENLDGFGAAGPWYHGIKLTILIFY